MKKCIILTAAIALFSTCLISASAATVKNHVALESAATSYLDMSAYATGYWLEIITMNGGGGGCSASINEYGTVITWSAPGSPRITFDGGPSYGSSPSTVPSGCTGFRVEGAISSGTSTQYVGIWYRIRYN